MGEKRVSLRRKFLLLFVLFSAIISIAYGMLAAVLLSRNLEREYVERGKTVADHLAEEAFYAIFIAGQGDLDYMVENMVSGDVIYAQIVNDGEVLAEVGGGPFDLSPITVRPGLEVGKRGLPNGGAHLDIVRSITGKPVATELKEHELSTVAIPEAEPEGEAKSYVRVGLSLASIEARIRKGFLLLGLLSAAFVGVGLLLGRSLYETVLGPVGNLTDAVRGFGRGESGVRATVSSGDELEVLAEEFNRMADAISEKDRQLKERNEALLKANRAKSEFLTLMSHELRTPLHSILGYANILREGTGLRLDVTSRAYAQSILRAGKYLLELIENILRFSRMEAGEDSLHLSAFDVGDLMAEAVQGIELMAQEKSLPIRTGVHAPILLKADRTKLKQVLINLLSNAVRYTFSGGISVSACKAEGGVQFAVEDTGIGIDPDDADIFEPFVRSDPASTGLGLGLTIAKRNVEMHGGVIWYESKKGGGSRFYFMIPCMDGGGDEGPGG